MADYEDNRDILPKVVVLLGPTASGKTRWGIDLAKEFNGEIVSADSRQVYKKMSIGTAKAPGEWEWNGMSKMYYVEDVPHHLIDFLDPGKVFTAVEFRDKTLKCIKGMEKRGTKPFIVGGTGLYIQALIDNLQIPRVPPNKKLRQSLEQKSNAELVKILSSIDLEAAGSIDPHNKRRIIRALEVCIFSGEPFSKQQQKGEPVVEALQIGVDIPRDVLYRRINERIDIMVNQGLMQEVEQLLKQKYSWELSSMSGIGYRQLKPYFDGVVSLEDAIENLKRDTRHYARRQLTWFRRDKRIKWCKTYEEAKALVKNFFAS
ncbi:MAG TPA: tRNA (adenosine(37)-N6)-dimethylallyltransferase MiaA [Candidatus Kapabacteria bacterium]|nr:tRNA (adenosine(37)-N6)-dimethylallyltransferase MiaA [Candidatus Kapabacteria bacterium]